MCVCALCWQDDNLHWSLNFHTDFGDRGTMSRSQWQWKDKSESCVFLTSSHPLSSNFMSPLQIVWTWSETFYFMQLQHRWVITKNGHFSCCCEKLNGGVFHVLFKWCALDLLHDDNGWLSCGSPRLVALGILGALTKLKSTANDLPYTSQVALGLFVQCNAQASKVAHCIDTWQ